MKKKQLSGIFQFLASGLNRRGHLAISKPKGAGA